MSRYCAQAIIVALVLGVAAGCDPGYSYQPVDSQGKPLPGWSQTIEGVRFGMEPFDTLIGSSSVLQYLDVENGSGQEVVVLGGQLITGDRVIEATAYDGPEHRDARTVPPGNSKRVLLSWPLGGAAAEKLQPDFTWVWRVQIGSTEHSLRVPMRRTRG